MVGRVEYVPNKNHHIEFMATRGMVGKHIRRRATALSILAKSQVGVKSKKLRHSIRKNMLEAKHGPMAEVGSNLDYALLHHEGSKPHQIRPKRAKVLRFKSRGRIVYAHSVMHPGTKPNRYLSDNLRKVI